MRSILFLFLVASLHASPKLIAHRGSSAGAPENTLAAFQLAWKEGADGIEADFRLSKDKRIVCIHDKDTCRTTGKNFVVADTSWEQLRTLDAGSWMNKRFSDEHLPLLEDILPIIPQDKFFFLEIKCGPEIVGPLTKLLKDADKDHTILISFDPLVIKACRKRIPEFQAHLISELDGVQKLGGEEHYLKILDDTGATGLQFNHNARITGDFLTKLRKTNRLTACWTVDNPGIAKRIAKMGVDFITTNRPAKIRKQTSWPESSSGRPNR